MSLDITVYMARLTDEETWEPMDVYTHTTFLNDEKDKLHLVPVYEGTANDIYDWISLTGRFAHRGIEKWMPQEIVDIIEPKGEKGDDPFYQSGPTIFSCSLAYLRLKYKTFDEDCEFEYRDSDFEYDPSADAPLKEQIKAILDAADLFKSITWSYGTDDDYRLIMEIA